MSKRDPEAPPVPALSLDPPSDAVTTLPGPQAEPGPGPQDRTGVPKRKRNRRTKAQLAAEKAAADKAQAEGGGVSAEDVARCEAALAATFEVLSKVLAKRRGPHWELDKEEAATLGTTWTVALAPYLPRIGAAVPWAAAAAVTWSLVQPRMARDAELANVPAQPSGPELTP